jgi:hypothetical protein
MLSSGVLYNIPNTTSLLGFGFGNFDTYLLAHVYF